MCGLSGREREWRRWCASEAGEMLEEAFQQQYMRVVGVCELDLGLCFVNLDGSMSMLGMENVA